MFHGKHLSSVISCASSSPYVMLACIKPYHSNGNRFGTRIIYSAISTLLNTV